MPERLIFTLGSMRKMEINRRDLLSQSAAIAGLLSIPGASLLAMNQAGLLVSAFSNNTDQHFIGVLSKQGELIYQLSVQSRGHAACISQDGNLAIFFARRPRRWMISLDIRTGKIVGETGSVEGRHFFGHGVMSHDNAVVFASENDYQNNQGVIGIYDVKNGLKRIDEIPSFGLGPHEIALLADGKTLVVGNGGIETHPDYGRRKLNLDSMSPSLSYIDLSTGKEMARYLPPHHQLSLRHLCVNQNDQVIIGAQFQGDKREDYPLVFSHKGEDQLQALSAQPLPNQRYLKQYIASVSLTADGRFAITSSPKGDRVSVWDLKKLRWLRDVSVPDVGGVFMAGARGQIMLSSGNGKIYLLDPEIGELKIIQEHAMKQWDNHLRGI